MPKKEKVWTVGNKGPTGPWVWHVWVKGSRKPLRMVAFDQQHIKDQLEGQQMVKAKRLPEEKDDFGSMPLGPKGSVINRPASGMASNSALKIVSFRITAPLFLIYDRDRATFSDPLQVPHQKTQNAGFQSIPAQRKCGKTPP